LNCEDKQSVLGLPELRIVIIQANAGWDRKN